MQIWGTKVDSLQSSKTAKLMPKTVKEKKENIPSAIQQKVVEREKGAWSQILSYSLFTRNSKRKSDKISKSTCPCPA